MTKSARIKNVTNLNSLLGLKQQDDVLYSEIDGYHYSINVLDYNNVVMYSVTILVDKVFDDETLKKIRKESKANINYTNWNGQLVLQAIFSLPLSKEKKVAQFNTVMNLIVSSLKENEVMNYDKCCFCQSESEEEVKWVVYQGLYLPAHNACIENQYQLQQALIDAENKNIKHLPKSIIFSFIGAIIGILPAFLILILTDWLFAIAYALSPVCAFLGYKLGKAPLRNYSTAIVVVESLIVSALSVIVYFAILLAAVGLPFAAIQEFTADVMALMVQVLIFDAVGIFISWGYIKKVNQSKVEK